MSISEGGGDKEKNLFATDRYRKREEGPFHKKGEKENFMPP